MGLSSVLSSALSGLRVTEQSLDLVSRNIANAETPGYTRKTLSPQTALAAGVATSVRAGEVGRELDRLLQSELRIATARQAGTEILDQFLQQIDLLLGEPGSVNALDTVYNEFTASLTELAASPDSSIVRQQVLAEAQGLTQQLNSLSENIQRLRGQAEQALAGDVREANDALKNLEKINLEIISSSNGGRAPADLLDARDREIDRLGKLFDLTVIENENGSVAVFTESGTSLFDGQAAQLIFDTRGAINAQSLYSPDPAQRGVGTILLVTPNGSNHDLLQEGVVRSGSVAAYAALRDDILVEGQNQLDEIASALALALSTVERSSTALASGGSDGFSVDLAGIQTGDRITIDYTDGGVSQRLTIVRVDDASQLPLSNDVTADPTDTVLGVDFSGGFAAAIAAIDTALGANVTAQLNGASTLEVLDDGAAALSDIDGLSVRITASALTDQGLGLPFFTDSARQPEIYSESLEGGPQKRGFAARIVINAALLADPSRLVVSSTSPLTQSGDSTRPLDLETRLNENPALFSPNSSIGSASVPFKGTIGEFIQRVIDFQGAQAATAERDNQSSTLIVDTLQERFTAETGVNMDEELSRLLILQNSYAANARVLSAVNEMLQLILQI